MRYESGSGLQGNVAQQAGPVDGVAPRPNTAANPAATAAPAPPAKASAVQRNEDERRSRRKSEIRRPNRNTAWSRMIFIILFYCSGHSSKSCIRQEQLDREQAGRSQQRPLKQGPIRSEPAELHLRFFQPIDVIVNALQLAAVGGAVKLGV